jgi:hypothetical protein
MDERPRGTFQPEIRLDEPTLQALPNQQALRNVHFKVEIATAFRAPSRFHRLSPFIRRRALTSISVAEATAKDRTSAYAFN